MATLTVGLGPRFPACLPAGRRVLGETSPARRCGTSRIEALVEVDLEALATDILTAALVEAHVPACAESITEGLDTLVAGRPGPTGGRLLAIVVASGHPCSPVRRHHALTALVCAKCHSTWAKCSEDNVKSA
jgi:hypothetical protein